MDDHLLIEARRLASETGRTFTAVVEDAVREALARRRAVRPQAPVQLVTFGGQGLMPGVDLDDSAALLALMEDARDPG